MLAVQAWDRHDMLTHLRLSKSLNRAKSCYRQCNVHARAVFRR